MPHTLAASGLLEGPGGLSPPVLFFFLGAVAALVRSNLRVPPAITKLLSLYLLWAIGFRGGVELLHGGLTRDVVLSLGAAVLLACVVPLYTYRLFRIKLSAANAAALCATYGSISAVTFMTACTTLEQRGIAYGGHMVAAMALMESPAIVIAVLMLKREEQRGPAAGPGDPAATEVTARATGGGSASQRGRIPWGKLLHEAFLNGPVLLLLGSLSIGMLTGQRGYEAFKPLCTDLFNGVLVFFLLDLGLVAARRLKQFRTQGPFLIVAAIAIPLVNAAVALVLARSLRLPPGDSVLLVVLAASASYIAVPAAMRLVIPKAEPGLYIPMALAITFPFNIAIGIPLYMWLVKVVQ